MNLDRSIHNVGNGNVTVTGAIGDQNVVVQTTPPPPATPSNVNSPTQTGAGPRPYYSGRTKLRFVQRLGSSWLDLATYLEIPSDWQDRPGGRGHLIWQWLEERDELSHLRGALAGIGRNDLAEMLNEADDSRS